MPKNKHTKDDIMQMIQQRDVYIWGSLIVGQGICRAFERAGIAVKSFVDSSPSLQGTTALGYPIATPENVLPAVAQGKGFIVVSSGHYDIEIAESCRNAGLRNGRDYILCRTLNDLDPSVDISGVCNLHCISCPHGNLHGTAVPGGFMSASTYGKVLTKLLHEIPWLGNIQLYAWGEPFLNPDLPEIIAVTRQAKVLVALSTNLNIRKDFSAVIAAKPDWLKVSTSGFGPNYEITHTGGKWERFHQNLLRLQELRNRFHPQMQVVVNYHLYKHNIGDDYRNMQQFCEQMEFIFRPNHAYLYPMDNVMAYREGKELSPEAQKTLDLLLMDIDEGLARSERQKHLPCPEECCFPINWDLSVRQCGVYYTPFIAENFFEEPLEDILLRRRQSDLCETCKNMALHRFTGVYLEEKLLDEKHTRKGHDV